MAQRWILARLRNETFFSLQSLNTRIHELLDERNLRPMKRLGGKTRRELFESLDRPALKEELRTPEKGVWADREPRGPRS